MGKKNKGKLKTYEAPDEKYLVVVNPWGGRQTPGFFNNVGAWFEIMLKGNRVDGIYIQGTHDNIVVELPSHVDIGPLLGAHHWSEILTPPYSNRTLPDSISYFYEYNYEAHGDPARRGWLKNYPTYDRIIDTFPVKRDTDYPPARPVPAEKASPFVWQVNYGKPLPDAKRLTPGASALGGDAGSPLVLDRAASGARGLSLSTEYDGARADKRDAGQHQYEERDYQSPSGDPRNRGYRNETPWHLRGGDYDEKPIKKEPREDDRLFRSTTRQDTPSRHNNDARASFESASRARVQAAPSRDRDTPPQQREFSNVVGQDASGNFDSAAVDFLSSVLGGPPAFSSAPKYGQISETAKEEEAQGARGGLHDSSIKIKRDPYEEQENEEALLSRFRSGRSETLATPPEPRSPGPKTLHPPSPPYPTAADRSPNSSPAKWVKREEEEGEDRIHLRLHESGSVKIKSEPQDDRIGGGERDGYEPNRELMEVFNQLPEGFFTQPVRPPGAGAAEGGRGREGEDAREGRQKRKREHEGGDSVVSTTANKRHMGRVHIKIKPEPIDDDHIHLLGTPKEAPRKDDDDDGLDDYEDEEEGRGSHVKSERRGVVVKAEQMEEDHLTAVTPARARESIERAGGYTPSHELMKLFGNLPGSMFQNQAAPSPPPPLIAVRSLEMEDDDDMDDDDGDDVQRRHVKEEDEYSPSSELLEMYGRAPGLFD